MNLSSRIKTNQNEQKSADIMITKPGDNYFDIKTNQNNEPESRLLNVCFTTEMYSEVIDGIYQEKKNINLNNYFNLGLFFFNYSI